MNKIWISHEPRGKGIDLQPLYDYARENGYELETIFSADFNVGLHTKLALDAAETFASKFDYSNDRWVIVGGDPIAGVICMIALVHEAIQVGATSIRSLRYIRERDGTGARTIPKYVEIEIPTGVHTR